MHENKPIDKKKLDPMANAFMEFFEKQYNVIFVDVTPEVEEINPQTAGE